MVRYPFELWILKVEPTGVDENGFETQGAEKWVLHSICYDRVMGKSQEYRSQNGDSFYYSSVLFMPKDTEDVPTETNIEVRQNGTIRLSGTAKRFSNDYRHCRLWV